MRNVSISDDFKNNDVKLSLGCICAKVTYGENNETITKMIDEQEKRIIKNFDTTSIREIPAIKATRIAYKKMGKDPSRYRSSAEAMARRLIQKKGMYRINNLVDAGNLISMKTGISLGAYDLDKIKGDILFRKGKEKETYKGIGRGEFNLEGLSVFCDEIGAFGNPTGDSSRTMITKEIKQIMIILISYGENQNLSDAIDFAKEILTNLCDAITLEEKIISNF